jgi:hypothetical protein
MKNYERRKEKGKTEKGEKGKTPKWPVHSWALSGSTRCCIAVNSK